MTHQEFLEKEGFDPKEEMTYVAVGNTFEIKEELKEAGFKFNKVLGWHAAKPSTIKCVSVAAKDVLEFSAFGEGLYRADAQALVKRQVKALEPKSNSEYVGSLKERLRGMSATVTKCFGFSGQYGYTNVIQFKVGENIFTWFTGTSPNVEVGESVSLTGTVKEHKEYDGEKQTVLTRCILK